MNTAAALAPGAADARGMARTAALVLAALALSLFAPTMALLVAWIAVVDSARSAPQWLAWPLAAFAHAGALVFASRSFDATSSDFVNYFDVYSATCAGSASLEDALLAFGSELGLPLVYRLLSALGLCGLSIHGLAWLQGFVTSTALLMVVTRHALRETPADERPLALGGLCLMFSFFLSTQLSRQAASSVFVLSALWLARTRRARLLQVLLGTLFHLTAPLVWGLAILLRDRLRRALPALLAVTLVSLLAFDRIVAFAVENVGAFEVLAKLAIYAVQEDDGGGPMSDLQAVVMLAVAGGLLLMRARREPRLRGAAQLLLGFALIGLALLPVPLAATRLTLPLAWIAIGWFLFRGLAGIGRPFAWAALLALLALRVGLWSLPGEGDHALWFAYPPASWMPGYYLTTF